MVAPYYADANLSQGGTDAGTSTNPWLGALGLQTLMDTLAAGEVGYIRGNFILNDGSRIGAGEDGDPIDLDGATGTSTAAIKVYGTDTDWTVNGVLATLDGNGVAVNCMIWGAGKAYWHFHNVTFTGATGDGVDGVGGGTTSCYGLWTNCHFDDNRGDGFDADVTANLRYNVFVQCSFNENDGRGLRGQNFVDAYYCEAFDNDSYGLTINASKAIGCIVHSNNASAGMGVTGSGAAAVNCVIEGNTGDCIQSQAGAMIIGCRLTNCTEAAINPTANGYLFYSYYDDSIDDATRIETKIKGVETNLTTGLEGYEDRANGKLNLIMGAAGFRTAIAIDANNDAVIAMGLPTVPIVWPGEN